MSKEDGGPAFPVEIRNTTDEAFIGCLGEEVKPKSFAIYTGVSVRDYFAAHAPAVPNDFGWADGETDLVQRMTRWRYAYADSMLAARVKQ